MTYRKPQSVALATQTIEFMTMSYLDDFGVGKPVPTLQVYNYVLKFGESDPPVTFSFFNTVLGNLRALGIINVDKVHKTISLTADGQKWFDTHNADGSVYARKAGNKVGA